jgi:uncharacterized cupin superfamily protein
MTQFITSFDRAPQGISGIAASFAATLDLTSGSLETVAEEKHISGINGAAFGVGNTKGAGEMRVRANAHLFLLVEEGALVIESDGALFVVKLGDSFVAPQGSTFTWKQEGDVAFSYSTCSDADAPAQIIPIVSHGARKISPPYSAELLLSEKSPQQAGFPFFTDSTTRWQVGTWSSETFERKAIPFPKDEYMYIHTGAAEFEAEPSKGGDKVGPRVSFLLAHKSVCTWKNEGFIDKTYCAVLDK